MDRIKARLTFTVLVVSAGTEKSSPGEGLLGWDFASAEKCSDGMPP